MFPSTDLRTKRKVEQEQDALTVVKVLSNYCRQGPGGQLDPHFSSSPLCILCSKGATCLGPSCKGKQDSKRTQPLVRIERLDTSMTIPGLDFLGSLANNPSKTARRSKGMRRIKCFPPSSDIFNYQGMKGPHFSSTKHNPVKPKTIKTKSKVPPLQLTLNVVENRKLQLFLINCGEKRKQKKKRRNSSISKTSMQRKVETSELPCVRLSSRKFFSSQIIVLPTSFQAYDPAQHFPPPQRTSHLASLEERLVYNTFFSTALLLFMVFVAGAHCKL